MNTHPEPQANASQRSHFSVDTAPSRGSIRFMASYSIPRLFARVQRGAVASFLAVAFVTTMALAADVPSLGEPGLASGSFSSMHMMLEKTFLKVDVATIDVKVGPAIQEKLKAARAGKAYSPAVEEELAKIAIGADRAVVQLKFVRDVSLSQWIDGVRESLVAAEKAGFISAAIRQQISDGLPVWFEPVKARGYHDGDRVLYRIDPSGLRTVAVTKDGQVLVDRTDAGKDKSHIVLSSYFAPGTDYRQLLLSSLK
jgi:hypothetical protein